MYTLCYEVWSYDADGHRILGAYWDVNAAWTKMLRLRDRPGVVVEVGVASGMEHDLTTGETRKRRDVK